jgi:hypothetical protein
MNWWGRLNDGAQEPFLVEPILEWWLLVGVLDVRALYIYLSNANKMYDSMAEHDRFHFRIPAQDHT